MLGATHEVVRTCGDENPPMDFLSHPEWLPAGHTRSSLERGSEIVASSLAAISNAFATAQRYAEKVWFLTVEYAYSCFPVAMCMPHGEAWSMLRQLQAAFLISMATILEHFAVSSATAQWIPWIGEPAQIIAVSIFSHRHLDFATSVISGLETMEPSAVVGVLHDLAMRIASSNCEMLAQLLAHFTLTKLPLPGNMRISGSYFPRFEFHRGSCCRRYHVLTHLVDTLAAGLGRVHAVEVGVNNALTSEYLLERFPDLRFDGVDPWTDAEAIHREATDRLARFGTRARLWRLRSDEAAPHFPLQSVDLVFIDGDHSREAVLADIQFWRPRLRPGGLLAGHDLFNPAFDGVLEALLEHLHEGGGAPSDIPGEKPTVHFGPDFVWWLNT